MKLCFLQKQTLNYKQGLVALAKMESLSDDARNKILQEMIDTPNTPIVETKVVKKRVMMTNLVPIQGIGKFNNMIQTRSN